MEQVSTQLGDIELDFSWVPLVQDIKVSEDFLLILTCVECQNKGEDLVLLMRHIIDFIFVFIILSQLGDDLFVLFDELFYFAPSILPILFINDLVYKFLEFILGYHLLLLFNFLIF